MNQSYPARRRPPRRSFALPAVAAALFLAVSGVFAASLLEEKLNLERSIQERTERLVEKIIGSRDMVVLVSVDLEEKAKAAAQEQRTLYPGMGMAEEEYLPGITYNYLPVSNAAQNAAGLSVKRIAVLVTLDQQVGDAIVERIRKEVSSLIGLDPVRGDVINVQKIAFAQQARTIRDRFSNWRTDIYVLIALVSITLFLFGPLRAFFKSLLRSMEMKVVTEAKVKTSDQSGLFSGAFQHSGNLGGGGIGGGGVGEILETGKTGTAKEEETRRFGFVARDNIKSLLHLVRKESPERIAIILNYLTPQLAAQVLAALPPQTQGQVIGNLAEVKVLDTAEVNAVEEEMKRGIEYLSGGEDYFLGLIDQADREMQENIIATLERQNSTIAERVRRSLFFFEDIVILDKNVVQFVIREAQRRNISIALCLKTASEDIKAKVFEALTEGARAILTEQIELMGEVPEKRILDEQKLVASLVRDLERAGVIAVDRSRKSGA